MLSSASFKQLLKALYPIDVTVEGSVIFVTTEQPEKVDSSITVMPSGIIIEVIKSESNVPPAI